ncbi:hypothetical protein M3Y97_00669300 [Aphelenchoides bicaudatus]|nr:hypothetical protein M3Y97_00669300 [Aphelenchoides bicaudatus]
MFAVNEAYENTDGDGNSISSQTQKGLIPPSPTAMSREGSAKTPKLGSTRSIVVLSQAWTTPSESVDLSHEQHANETKESRLSFIIQTFFPFLLAGLGMVAAGLLLEKASSWYFLSTVEEALIMVPALLGLKGNLEMTLASRLSTLANLGQMDSRSQQLNALISNVALVQAQAIVVSSAASVLTLITTLIEGEEFVWNHFVSLTLVAILTASVASCILSTVMVFLAIVCRKCNMNPDNICTPIAAMLGDVTTLAFLILFGTWLTYGREKLYVLQTIVLVCFLLSTILWISIARRNPTTLEVLKHGWYIILIAMLISSSGGYVLKFAVQRFKALAAFQPVINGVGGNLVAVQASKISTYLHRVGKPGLLPANKLITYANPLRTFMLKEEESVHAWFLLLMSIPGHTVFLVILFLIQSGGLFPYKFYLFYIFVGLVAILLYICQFVCRVMWRCKVNPDNNAIPLLTSLGDLLGTSLLTIMFIVLTSISTDSLAIFESEAP